MTNTFGLAGSGSVSVPAIWSKYMADTLDAASVMSALVSRTVQADLGNGGDYVHVNKYGTVTINSYTVGSDTSVGALTVTDAQLTLDQRKYFRFVIDDVEKAASHLDLVKGWTKRAMIAMAQTIDDRLFTHYADVQSGNTIGSTSAPMTLTPDNIYTNFVQAGLLLDNANVDAEGRVAVIDPTTKSKILKSADFIKATATGDSVVRKGEIGELAGFRVVVSNRITTVTSTKPLMFFGPEFISLAVRLSPDKFETYKPEAQFGTGVKGLAYYGSKVFNAGMGVTLYSAV